MQAALRRAVGTMLFVFGILCIVLYLFGNKPAGTLGFSSTFLNGSPTARVDTVMGDPAKSGGLAPGDLVRSMTDRFSDRSVLYLLGNAPNVSRGDRVALRVQRGSGFHNVLLIAGPDPNAPAFEAAYFAALSLPILILGWFVLWVKPGSSDAVTLGLLLLILGLFIAIPDRIGPPAFAIALEIAGSACYIFGVLIAAIFFARYSDGEGTRHSRLRRYLMYLAIGLTVIELARMVTLFLSVAYVGRLPWLQWPVPPILVSVIVTLVLFAVAFHGADATQRMRLRWLGGSYFIGFSGPLFIPSASIALGSRFSTIDQVLFESTLFILAAGLTYGVLRRRVIDLSFVLNRALVFTIVSGAVVAFFLGFEWLVGSLFIHISPRTSYAVDAAAAILIGVFLGPLHSRVDHFIDRALFAKRHASENALRHLATKCSSFASAPLCSSESSAI